MYICVRIHVLMYISMYECIYAYTYIYTDHVQNEDVLRRCQEERNILQTMKGRYGNCIGHILCGNCLL
jgi:hypothetical protein